MNVSSYPMPTSIHVAWKDNFTNVEGEAIRSTQHIETNLPARDTGKQTGHSGFYGVDQKTGHFMLASTDNVYLAGSGTTASDGLRDAVKAAREDLRLLGTAARPLPEATEYWFNGKLDTFGSSHPKADPAMSLRPGQVAIDVEYANGQHSSYQGAEKLLPKSVQDVIAALKPVADQSHSDD